MMYINYCWLVGLMKASSSAEKFVCDRFINNFSSFYYWTLFMDKVYVLVKSITVITCIDKV